MKLKSAIKYRYTKIFKISLIFYILMLELAIASCILKWVTDSLISIEDFFRFIMYGFTFAIGFFSYTSELNMFLQNGVSRQSAHKSFLTVLPLNIAFAVISMSYEYISTLIDRIRYPEVGFYCEHAFAGVGFTVPKSEVKDFFIYVFILTCIYLLTMCIGYMSGAILRTMRLFYKVLFGTVIVATVILCITLYNTFWQELQRVYLVLRASFVGVCYSSYGRVGNFVVAILTFCVIAVSISHLLINRATVKKGADRK